MEVLTQEKWSQGFHRLCPQRGQSENSSMWLKLIKLGKSLWLLALQETGGKGVAKDFGLLLNQHPEIQVFLNCG